MKRIIPLLTIFIVLVYAVYNAKFRDVEKVASPMHKHYKEHIKTHDTTHYEDERAHVNSD